MPLRSASVPQDTDGAFDIQNVVPGTYRLEMTGLPDNFYIKEARAAGVDALHQQFAVAGSDSGPLRIVLSPNGGQITGTVNDSRQQPVAGARIVLVPDRNRKLTNLYKSSMTDSSGQFAMRGIAPGNYKLFAWDEIEPNSYLDPDVISKFEPRGTPVRIQESGNPTVNLTVIVTGVQ